MIRRATSPADWGDIEYLQRLTLPEDTPLGYDLGFWWITRIDDVPAAFAALTPSTRYADCMYLSRSGVAPSFRGMGLQKRLIRVRERFARSLAMNWLVSDTTDNPASANSLISCGFRIYKPAHPWGPDGATYWRKKIQ